MSNVPDNNPKTRAGGANKLPLHLIPPTALAHLAMAFADGAGKYRAYNWREEPISSSVYYGAALRHLFAWWEGEDYAEDSDVHHLAHAMACMAMVLDTMDRPGGLNDNRPPPSEYKKLADELVCDMGEKETTFGLHDIPAPRTLDEVRAVPGVDGWVRVAGVGDWVRVEPSK